MEGGRYSGPPSMYGLSGPKIWIDPISGGRFLARKATSIEETTGPALPLPLRPRRYWRKRAAGLSTGTPSFIGTALDHGLHPSSGSSLSPLRVDHVTSPPPVIPAITFPQDATE